MRTLLAVGMLCWVQTRPAFGEPPLPSGATLEAFEAPPIGEAGPVAGEAPRIEHRRLDLRRRPKPMVPGWPASGRSLADIIEGVKAGVLKVKATVGYGTAFPAFEKGVFVTNAHVIALKNGVGKVTLHSDSGGKWEASVLALNRDMDIAFLKVEGAQFPWEALTLGNLARLREGDEVLAVGYPLGLRLTVSRGIVSGLGRDEEYVSYIQTDAAINPGSSGGPLLSGDGLVVGMNTSFLSPRTETWIGIGFAITAKDIDRAWRQFKRTGRLQAPWLGIHIAHAQDGVVVRQVVAEGPAAKAGLAPGDVIVALDGTTLPRDTEEVESVEAFVRQIRRMSPGDTLRLTIRRGSSISVVPVLLEPEEPTPPQRVAETDRPIPV